MFSSNVFASQSAFFASFKNLCSKSLLAGGRLDGSFCRAGFFGPYVSGILFDAFGTYRVAFQVSGLASLLSSVAATTLKGEAAVLREKRAMELRAVEAAARNDTRYVDCTRTKENEWGSIET